MSTYPDVCSLRLERRTIPGETPDEVRREIEALCGTVSAREPTFRANVHVTLSQPPSDVGVDAPIVSALDRAVRGCGGEARVEGMSAWTDAALLNEAGIPAICFGPGDMGLAHAATEWVELSEVEGATEILARLAVNWCGVK
jgi:acetylornithine deacetylase